MTAPPPAPHEDVPPASSGPGGASADRTQRRRRPAQVLRRRPVAALSLVAVVGLSGLSLATGGLSFNDGAGEDRDGPVAVATPAQVPPPATPTVATVREEVAVAVPDSAVVPAGVPGEPCQVAPGGTDLGPGAIGAAALGASALGCVIPTWQALPPTALERTDPRMLLAQVTREQAVDPVDYRPDDLVPLQGGPYEARAEVGEQLVDLIDAAVDAGHPSLTVTSGFRSYETQAGTFADWAARLGEERADVLSARPGHSEHQLGLAVDLAGRCSYQCFGASEDGRWVAENAYRWGFIIRYPEDGFAVTGYAWEPWHLRYVGPRAAWGMHLTGEVYWENFQPVAARAAGLD